MANKGDIYKVALPNGDEYNFKDKYVRENYRALNNNDFDTINVTELNAGNVIVTGAARFLNTINGSISGNAATATNATNDANGLKIDTGYLKLSGGTMTGKITSNYNPQGSWLYCGQNPDIHINNTGASGWIGGNTKTGRHVICTYASNDDLLYFNWYSNTTLAGTENKFDKSFTWNPSTNVLSANISGNASTATTAQYVSLIASNEIRFANKPSSAVDVYFNYQWADGTASAMINKYVFMNGNKTKCPVEASKFIGPLQGNADTATSATKATQDSDGNTISSTYVKVTGDPTIFKASDIAEGAANLSTQATAHRITVYRNGMTIPYQMDNANDGGMIRVRGTSKSNCIFELGTWDDSGAGETIQFNYYPTTSQVTPTYSVTVPKATGTLSLTNQTISNITRSGTTFTATRADGTTFTFDQKDDDTKYGISASGDNITLTAGGTGTSVSLSTLINGLATGSSTPVDADYYVSQYVNGGTTTTSYHRRPMSALWAYIKGKADSTYLASTTKYAGSSSVGGAANSANQLNDDTSYINSGTSYVTHTTASTLRPFLTRFNNVGIGTESHGCLVLSNNWSSNVYNAELLLGMGDRPYIYFRGKNNGTYTTWLPVGKFSAVPTTGQVVITDGTEGGIKSSGYTIAKSVPSNAVFTDTNYYHTTGSWSGLTYTATANGGAGALAFTIPTGATATTVAVGNHNHDGSYSKIHATSWDFTTTKPLSSYVTFDQSLPTGAPKAAWFNGFVSSHNSYLASYILNEHRTANWYVGYGQFDTSTSSATAPTWYLLLHSTNYTDYTVKKDGTGASGTWGISVTGSAGSVAWTNVTGKPSTFTPSAHTHPVSDLTWGGGVNLTTTATANNQEWSIDLTPGSYTGTYWHVWSGKNSKTILACYPDNNSVTIPNGTLTVANNITTTGHLIISDKSGSYSWNEGIRINRAGNGYCSLVMGGVADSTSGAGDCVWWMGCNPSSLGRKLYFTHNGSTQSSTYFYADSSSQQSPNLRIGGVLGVGNAEATKTCQMKYNENTDSLDFVFVA